MSLLRTGLSTPLIWVCLIAMSLPLSAESQDPGALRDLREVSVTIEGDRPEYGRNGLDWQYLSHEIGRRLQAAGLQVIGPAESLRRPGAGLLRLELHINRTPFYYSFLVFLRLDRKLKLSGSDAFIARTVWSDWKIGGAEFGHLDKLHGPVLDLADELMADYRRQNPGHR